MILDDYYQFFINYTTLKACEVLIDSFAGVFACKHLFLLLNSYMAFYDIHGFLTDSSKETPYHQFLFNFS